jgi:hypothetical protein
MKCLICDGNMLFHIAKDYHGTIYKDVIKDIVEYYKCKECGLTVSKTHQLMSADVWSKLNYDLHHYEENNKRSTNQPPYLEQALLIKVLAENLIIDSNNILDYAGGYGSLSKVIEKYFGINLPVYEKFVHSKTFHKYVSELKNYNTVINSATFEHIFHRKEFDKINSLVDNSGVLILHTVVCENIPSDSNWFYITPVHTTFHTNKSMKILMKQWGYQASIYCLSAKSWILFKKPRYDLKEKVKKINKEFQTEYLIYKEGFVDYWKGF